MHIVNIHYTATLLQSRFYLQKAATVNERAFCASLSLIGLSILGTFLPCAKETVSVMFAADQFSIDSSVK